MSLWDILPCEIQDKIREESSSSYIQEIYRKNRNWYYQEINLLGVLDQIMMVKDLDVVIEY